MAEESKLRRLYEEELARGPFPTKECRDAHIRGKLHGELVVYLADIAGLASRGEKGLASLSAQEKARFRHLASRSLFERCAEMRDKISPNATPKLYALVEATERARFSILEVITPSLT